LAHTAVPIDAEGPQQEPLSIDVAVAGGDQPSSAIVVSSGLHGVEGFFGSAVQLAFLECLPSSWRPPAGMALILLHALNPFGFAWRRRFNEDNVDLNRNFLLPGERYSGSPPLCDAFRQAMMPRGRGRRVAPWSARIAQLALRHGMKAFWETLPVGQYDFPDWLFFGGHAPSAAGSALERFLPRLLEGVRDVVHLDFHTGLGRWSRCELLLSDAVGATHSAWWRSHFGARHVREPRAQTGSYQVRGGLGPWLAARFPACRYRFATAEFGTYSPSRVVRALVDELRLHTAIGLREPDHPVRRRLAEAFVPRNRQWRAAALTTGLSLVHQAVDILRQPAEAELVPAMA
jgi:hypothetical protein